MKVDPKNPDIVYTASVVAWKSTDGGKTFTGWRGAPGGDDYHRIWINPNDPNIILLAGDQGAIVTVNGGADVELLVQPADGAVLPREHGQRVSVPRLRRPAGERLGVRRRAAATTARSRSATGIRSAPRSTATSRPIPLDPGHRLRRQADALRPPHRPGAGRHAAARRRTSASCARRRCCSRPLDPRHALLRGERRSGRRRTAGRTGRRSARTCRARRGRCRRTSASTATPARGASRRAAASSTRSRRRTIDPNIIWAGTDDGLIHVTRDGGKTWTNVTPAAADAVGKVSLLDASHFDADTAYAAINTLRLDDLRPHIYRTHDGGRTWTRDHAAACRPAASSTPSARTRCGAACSSPAPSAPCTSRSTTASSWQSLRLNMPATSIRDLVVKDDDLVVGTHGRGFWILDDITPLRQITADIAKAQAFLFRPAQTAWRVRWNKNTDTPLPPDEPAAPNPPDGVTSSAICSDPARPARSRSRFIEGRRARCSGTTRATTRPSRRCPGATFRTTGFARRRRSRPTPGLHRFVWDLRYAPPPVDEFDVSDCRRAAQHAEGAAGRAG